MYDNKVQYTMSLKDLLSDPLKQADRNVDNFENSVNEAEKSVKSLSNAMNNTGRGFLQNTQAFAFGSLLADGIKRAGQEAVTQIKSVLSAGMDAGKLRTEFSVLGKGIAGNQLYDNLTKYIQDSIFGTELYGDAKTLLAFGESVNDIMPDLKMLGDVAMGDKEKMSALTLAFAQTTSAGKLMGQDLLQYINAGFNPLQVISEKTGESMASLKDKMSEGAISAKMVKDAFKSATSEGGLFYGMLEKIGETPFGKMQALEGNIQAAKQRLGEALLPAMSDFFDAMKPIIDKLPAYMMKLKPMFESLGKSVVSLVQWIDKNSDKIGTWLNLLKKGAEIYLGYKAITLALTAAEWAAVNVIRIRTGAYFQELAVVQRLISLKQILAATTAEGAAVTSAASMAAGEASMLGGAMSGASSVIITGVSIAAAAVLAGKLGEIINDKIGLGGESGVAQSIDSYKSYKYSFSKERTGNYNLVPIGNIKNISGEPVRYDTLWATKNVFKREEILSPQMQQNIKTSQLLMSQNKKLSDIQTAKSKQQTVASSSMSADMNKITGQQVKNYNIVINDGLVKNFTVNTTNLREASSEVKRAITQTLTDAINDSQISD